MSRARGPVRRRGGGPARTARAGQCSGHWQVFEGGKKFVLSVPTVTAKPVVCSAAHEFKLLLARAAGGSAGVLLRDWQAMRRKRSGPQAALAGGFAAANVPLQYSG